MTYCNFCLPDLTSYILGMIESDAVVTSTVPEGELAHPVTRKSAPPLSAADSAKPELSDLKSPPSLNGLGFGRVEGADGNSHKPAWRILSQLKSRDPLSDPAPDLSPGLDEARLTELQEQTYFTDFEIPEMEFDEFGLELAENRDSPPEASAFDHMGTGDLIDEDFERELGAAAKELSVQEVIDADFPDISRLGILQIAGDDKLGRKVIIFSACRLPAADLIDHQRLLL
ncbi:unnamed protein product [Calicophoron daubneyi]|uniref:Uncharacterized protein n=1 Tax=Calicophoron daubneyi TaxID=300641 RepID=A0AAV2T7P3_CALDB